MLQRALAPDEEDACPLKKGVDNVEYTNTCVHQSLERETMTLSLA